MEKPYEAHEADGDPAPESGLPAGNGWSQYTQSWWAGQWMKALTRLVARSRLARGWAYVHGGRVTDLEIRVGQVMARVQGNRPMPYRVQLDMVTLTEAEWERAIQAMVGQAIYAAQLLNGEVPPDIEELLRAANVHLFPTGQHDLAAYCTCPDAAGYCNHIAAACLAVGERLDEDPFLLFAMRGRTREQIMAALRARRAEDASDRKATSEQPGAASGRAVDPPLEECQAHFWQMGEEAQAIQVHVALPDIEVEVLKVLGDPPFTDDEALHGRLIEVYRSVSRKALGVAFGE